MTTPVLSARNITKRFGPVVALAGVTFDLVAGECHALCGENGAGKSTLIKTLSGIHPFGSYEGELLVDGKPAAFRSTKDAERAGLAVIYQELALVDEMSVAENICLGREPTSRAGLIDWHGVFAQARALLDRFELDLDPEAKVASLGVGHRQLVEIVKALAKDSRVLILDEPTAALSTHEVEILLDIIRGLKARGVTCVYISHRLEEVTAIADRVTVLRDGKTVETLAAADVDRAGIIRRMVGRELGELFPRRAGAVGAPLLSVEGLSVARDKRSPPVLRGVSFEVRAGEVFGIGGLMGAGRTELLMHLFGAFGVRVAGRVGLLGAELRGPPHEVIRRGLVLVSEDRKRYGLVLERAIGFNLSLSSLGGLSTRFGLIDERREHEENGRYFRSLRVKAPGLETVVGGLSGGNQQKVVLGKATMTGPRVVFLDEPTRGIDVGAKIEVYELINELTAAGHAVVLVSSELPELMGMSDRVMMLHEGRPGATFARAEATAELLMAAALGDDPHALAGG